MPVVSVVFGILLIALGVWGYWGGSLGWWEPFHYPASTELHPTALIPAYFGGALLLLGLLAFKASFLKHAMHAAAVVGLLGFAGSGYMLVSRWMKAGKVEGAGGASQTLMTVLCGVFLALCINSFIQARRRRRAAAPIVPGR